MAHIYFSDQLSKMKKIIFFLLILFPSLHSAEWMTELRMGYFYPTSSIFREIYKSGGIEGEIEVLKDFENHWKAWGNINYFRKNGHSIGLHDKTTIDLIPITFGLKYQFLECNCISPYLGIGVGYTIANVKNHSDFVKKHVVKAAPGFVIKSGAYINLTNDILLDIFADYYYQEMHFYIPKNRNIGGLRIGLGLGYCF